MTKMVSVIIPVYNGEEFLAEAIESVLNQTYSDFEIVIVNDGSTDNSQVIIDNYQSRYQGIIRTFKQQNGGVSKARNMGIAQAKGEFIAFLDQDDIWLPNNLEVKVNVFKDDSEIGMSVSGSNVVTKDGKWMHSVYKESVSRSVLRKSLLISNIVGPPSCTIVKRDCFMRVGCFDENLGGPEDIDMWFRIVNYYKIKFIETPLVNYRLHSNNAHLNVEKIKTSQKRFILKHRAHYHCLDRNKAYGFVYLDAAREYWEAKRRILSLLNALISVLIYPFRIYIGDDKYKILLKALIKPF